MKVKVTKRGVFIPLKFLKGVEEVEIRKEKNLIVVVPTTNPDPILKFGKHPVCCGVSDASDNHDKYIYDIES